MKYKIYDCHDITEILLKVALNTIPLTLKINKPKKSIYLLKYLLSCQQETLLLLPVC
jgi:hypothetical protein